jgi:type IV secretion system protein VirB3
MPGSARNAGLTADPVFVGATRPPMRWGVTYAALLGNLVLTMEVFLLSRNLLTLLVAVPVHGVQALLCARDPRCFDLLLMWTRTRFAALLRNQLYWRASSYSPLALRRERRLGTRRGSLDEPTVYLQVQPVWRC